MDLNIIGTRRTQSGFVESIIHQYTADCTTNEELCDGMAASVDALKRLDIFRSVDMGIEKDQMTVVVEEASRLAIKSGTEISGQENIVYFRGTLRNLFGRGEKGIANLRWGSRRQGSIECTVYKPFVMQAVNSTEVSLFRSMRPTETGVNVAVTGDGHGVVHRVSGGVSLDENRLFSALRHTWAYDKRSESRTGCAIRGVGEISNLHVKGSIEGQCVVCGPWDTSIVLAGMTGALKEWTGCESRTRDRFALGGPQDVRGFKSLGLGNLFAAASARIISPIPWITRKLGIKAHAFVNGGQIGDEWSKEVDIACGLGLCLETASGKLELNYALPLLTEDEVVGIQFGVSGSWL